MKTLIGLLLGAVLFCSIGASINTHVVDVDTPAQNYALDSVPFGTPQSVVNIEAEGFGHGSGFYIGGSRFITAGHVAEMVPVGGFAVLKYQDENGQIFQTKAWVIWIDKAHDVALLQSETANATLATKGILPANLACDIPDDAVGTSVVSIGYPLSAGLHYAWGHVASRVIYFPLNPFPGFEGNKYLGTDLMVAPGNSGGPVFDRHGYVVGMSDMIMKYANLSFLIPRSTICNSLKEPLPIAP